VERGCRTLVLSVRRLGGVVFHATKPEMIGSGVDFAFAARADDLPGAILVVAKERAAAMDPFPFGEGQEDLTDYHISAMVCQRHFTAPSSSAVGLTRF
jgi:hypothetical protein